MAKQDKLIPARRQRERPDDSLLIRSAESLGRVIGSLQRQLDGATKHLKSGTGDMLDRMPFTGSDGDGARNNGDGASSNVRRTDAATGPKRRSLEPSAEGRATGRGTPAKKQVAARKASAKAAAAKVAAKGARKATAARGARAAGAAKKTAGGSAVRKTARNARKR